MWNTAGQAGAGLHPLPGAAPTSPDSERYGLQMCQLGGRQGRGGESCQHAHPATLGAWPGAESLPGSRPPRGTQPEAHGPWPRPPAGTRGLPAASPALPGLFSPLARRLQEQPSPVPAGSRAAPEGLRPAALAGTRGGNCSWQRARRALGSWHRRRRNSVTAGRQARRLQSAYPHTAPAAVFQAGRLAPGAAGEPEKLLCATRKGLFSKQDR